MLALAVSLAVLAAAAQDVRELSDEARKAYASGVKEATTMLRERRFVEARIKLDALAKDRPREPQARFLRGVLETDEGHVDAAIDVYRGLIEDYPELPEPYNNLAVLQAQRGEYEAARVMLETAVRTAPNWAVARENLGDIYIRLAGAEYERAAKLDRANKTAPAKLVLVRELLTPDAAAKPKS
jgi:Flp pilus assembly protein TadD